MVKTNDLEITIHFKIDPKSRQPEATNVPTRMSNLSKNHMTGKTKTKNTVFITVDVHVTACSLILKYSIKTSGTIIYWKRVENFGYGCQFLTKIVIIFHKN